MGVPLSTMDIILIPERVTRGIIDWENDDGSSSQHSKTIIYYMYNVFSFSGINRIVLMETLVRIVNAGSLSAAAAQLDTKSAYRQQTATNDGTRPGVEVAATNDPRHNSD